MITFRYSSTNLNRMVHRFSALLHPSWTWREAIRRVWKNITMIHTPRASWVRLHVGPPTDRGCEGRVSLACRTSFPVGPGKSIQRLRHDVQHPRRAPERVPRWLPYCMSHCRRTPWRRRGGGEDEEGAEERRMRQRRANERWQRHRMEVNEEDVDANRIAIYPRARRL